MAGLYAILEYICDFFTSEEDPCPYGTGQNFLPALPPLAMAAAYLLIFAVGVLYLRVTISIPPEGDDKLTLNKWLFDLHRMPYAQFLLQDLQGRLRYFTPQEPRFFPLSLPNAVGAAVLWQSEACGT